jgi:uncharacterized protein with PCYCGC motif
VRKLLVLAILGTAGCARTPPPSTTPPAPAQSSQPAQSSAPPPPSKPAIPPFRESVSAVEQLPKPLPPERFPNHPVVARVYRIAGQIPAVLAQQPCYCYCDAFGHGNLLDCFTTDHGAG